MTRRGALLLPAAALAVHQLRYLLAYGPSAGTQLAEQGHAYLHSLAPWLVLLAAAAFGAALARAATRRDDPEPVRLARVWTLAAAGLVAIYVGQELLEGLLESGHPPGLEGVLGHGGWLALPSAVLVAGALALALRTAERLVARLLARAATTPRATPLLFPPAHLPRRRGPLATAAAGRAPPGSLSTAH